MRIGLCLTACAVVFALPVAAEPLPVQLKDAATWKLIVEHHRDETRGGKQTSRATTSTYSLAWRRRGEDDGQLTMTPVDFELGPGAPPELAQAGLPKRPIILAVDAALTPTQILNEAEIRDDLERLLEGSLKGQPAETRAMVKQLLDAAAGTLVTRDMSMVALGQGTDLRLGEVSEYEDSLPNPLGGPAIRTRGSFKLETYDPASGRAALVWRQSLDPASMRESVGAMLTAMAKDMSADKADELKHAMSSVAIQRDDACRYDIDLRTGLAATTTCTSELAIAAPTERATRSDRWIITQSLPENP